MRARLTEETVANDVVAPNERAARRPAADGDMLVDISTAARLVLLGLIPADSGSESSPRSSSRNPRWSHPLDPPERTGSPGCDGRVKSGAT
jgi:hypothetical protein